MFHYAATWVGDIHRALEFVDWLLEAAIYAATDTDKPPVQLNAPDKHSRATPLELFAVHGDRAVQGFRDRGATVGRAFVMTYRAEAARAFRRLGLSVTDIGVPIDGEELKIISNETKDRTDSDMAHGTYRGQDVALKYIDGRLPKADIAEFLVDAALAAHPYMRDRTNIVGVAQGRADGGIWLVSHATDGKNAAPLSLLTVEQLSSMERFTVAHEMIAAVAALHKFGTEVAHACINEHTLVVRRTTSRVLLASMRGGTVNSPSWPCVPNQRHTRDHDLFSGRHEPCHDLDLAQIAHMLTKLLNIAPTDENGPRHHLWAMMRRAKDTIAKPTAQELWTVFEHLTKPALFSPQGSAPTPIISIVDGQLLPWHTTHKEWNKIALQVSFPLAEFKIALGRCGDSKENANRLHFGAPVEWVHRPHSSRPCTVCHGQGATWECAESHCRHAIHERCMTGAAAAPDAPTVPLTTDGQCFARQHVLEHVTTENIGILPKRAGPDFKQQTGLVGASQASHEAVLRDLSRDAAALETAKDTTENKSDGLAHMSPTAFSTILHSHGLSLSSTGRLLDLGEDKRVRRYLQHDMIARTLRSYVMHLCSQQPHVAPESMFAHVLAITMGSGPASTAFRTVLAGMMQKRYGPWAVGSEQWSEFWQPSRSQRDRFLHHLIQLVSGSGANVSQAGAVETAERLMVAIRVPLSCNVGGRVNWSVGAPAPLVSPSALPEASARASPFVQHLIRGLPMCKSSAAQRQRMIVAIARLADDVTFFSLVLAMKRYEWWPIETLPASMATQVIERGQLLAVVPELSDLRGARLPPVLSLLTVSCLMVAKGLTALSRTIDLVNVLVRRYAVDTTQTVRLLLQVPDYARTANGQRLISELLPQVKSQRMDVLFDLVEAGSAPLLTAFAVSNPHHTELTAQIAREYKCGTTTIFHRLCAIKSFAESDARVSMMKALVSSTAPTGYEKFKTSACNGSGAGLGSASPCPNPTCPMKIATTPQPTNQQEIKRDSKVTPLSTVAISTEVDALNVCDAHGRTPLDYASLWADRKHVDALTALGMTACDDLTCLYRFQSGKLCRTFAIPASVSPQLFPSRSKDMLDSLRKRHDRHDPGQSSLNTGNFGAILRAADESGGEIAVKRLYSTSAPVTNAALRISALGNLSSSSVAHVVALDSDDKNHLLIGVERMEEGSLAQCVREPRGSPFKKLLAQRDEAGYVCRLHVAYRAAQALALLHRSHAIHGDVHPGHILLTDDPGSRSVTCKLGGLDLSPSLHDTPSHIRLELWAPWTMQNNAFPPELIPSSTSNHVNNYTQLSDVYSLGAVLRWLFYYDLKDVNRSYDLKHVIDGATESEPKNRTTAQQLTALLQLVLSVHDPHDWRDKTAVMWTVTEATGREFRLGKVNWRAHFNRLSLPGANFVAGEKQKKPVTEEKKPAPPPPPIIDNALIKQVAAACTWLADGAREANLAHELCAELTKAAKTVAAMQLPTANVFLNVPTRHWPLFGRKNHRERLEQLLEEHGRVVILGQSGMGKSSLAAEYCHINRHKYKAIAWLSMHGLPHVVVPARQVLMQLDPTANPKKSTLSTTGERRLESVQMFVDRMAALKPSLMVVDDAMVRDFPLIRPPAQSGVRWIVTSAATSTAHDWRDYPQLELKSLEQDNGPRFFDGIDGKNAAVLSSVLGFSPLLLTLAASYSHHCRQTSDSFLAFLQLQMKASNSRDYATSCVDFLVQQVPLLDKSQTATDLLSFASLLASTRIPARWFVLFLTNLRKSDVGAIRNATLLLHNLKLLTIDNFEAGGALDLKTSYCTVHPTVALHAVRDQIIRKDAARICKATLVVLEEVWKATTREKLESKQQTDGSDDSRDTPASLLPHIVALSDQAVAPSITGFKAFAETAAKYASDLDDYPMSDFLKAKVNTSAPIGTSRAQLLTDTSTAPPNRLKIPDFSCDIWQTVARFNGQYTQRTVPAAPAPGQSGNRLTTITVPIASDITGSAIEPSLDKYMRNLRSHYAPLPVRNEQWAVFERMVREFLSGYFVVTTSSSERASEAGRRQLEFETEFKQSKQHTAFHLTTHAHSQLIRILAKLANFFTAHFRQHPDFEKGILQLLDFADAFGPSGNKLFDAFTKHEYGEREIVFCFRRYDGEMHTNNYRQHPPGSDVHTGLFSFTVRGVLLTREEMEMAMDDPLLRGSSQQAQARPEQKLLTTDVGSDVGSNRTTSTSSGSKDGTFQSDLHQPTTVMQLSAAASTAVSESREAHMGKMAIATASSSSSSSSPSATVDAKDVKSTVATTITTFLGCAVARLMSQLGFIDDQFTCIMDQKAGKDVKDAKKGVACVNCASKTWGAHSVHVQEVRKGKGVKPKGTDEYHVCPFFGHWLLIWYHPQQRLASPFPNIKQGHAELYPADGYVTLQWCADHKKMCVAKPTTMETKPCLCA